ncbi:MAG TPA: cobalamin-independent methionine synthase II family protein [Steroidobacteraceae bacterium]|nr:cobalamin-independent methionine synthase II family protein [Steroidobacteraceae bacterium]
MRRSTDRILTTHVGSLPAPKDLWNLANVDPKRLLDATRDVVLAQRRCGIDIINEGELTKGGSWVGFVNERLTGFEPAPPGSAGELLVQSADWEEFSEFYRAAIAGGTLFEQTREAAPPGPTQRDWACTGPVTYCGQAALQREIDSLKEALGEVPAGDAFLTSTAPASMEPGRLNRYYSSEEQFVYALADAMRVEYHAIADAGLLVQVDDAWLAALWDRIGVKMGLAAYKRYCALRVEALNHALKGIPPEQVRYHLCWGSWHGPHAHDIPLADMVDVLLSVNAQTYLFEAANARHEHEYVLWKRVKLPDDKILAPGVVSHATTLIEHPELVAERIRRFADIVGRERVIASTDCGLGLRCHPQIAWAKLRTLAQGATLASQALWGRERPLS